MKYSDHSSTSLSAFSPSVILGENTIIRIAGSSSNLAVKGTCQRQVILLVTVCHVLLLVLMEFLWRVEEANVAKPLRFTQENMPAEISAYLHISKNSNKGIKTETINKDKLLQADAEPDRVQEPQLEKKIELGKGSRFKQSADLITTPSKSKLTESKLSLKTMVNANSGKSKKAHFFNATSVTLLLNENTAQSHKFDPALALHPAAQSYLSAKNISDIDLLSEQVAAKQFASASMSEMDADLLPLTLSQPDYIAKTKTHQHRLDPNRIVRKGDTCYRVVSVGTPLNPYAENLGYPFACGGDKTQQALDAAIKNRLGN